MKLWWITGVAAVTATACASNGPSTELVNARQAYTRAQSSPASELTPDKLLGARQALDAAERAHKDDARSDREKTLAYIALRRAELAEAYADIALSQQREQRAQQSYSETEHALRSAAEQRARTAARSLDAAQNQLAETRSELSEEQAARQKAEQRAAAAIESVKKIAAVKEEARGMVITLSGAVLFASAKSELIPIAERKLDDVVEALKSVGNDRKIRVEGYTDSRGAEDFNLKLSQERADAVRSYLVSQGIPAERVTAQGKGEQNPVAPNDTAEGRANNRRVEIVVEPRANGASG